MYLVLQVPDTNCVINHRTIQKPQAMFNLFEQHSFSKRKCGEIT